MFHDPFVHHSAPGGHAWHLFPGLPRKPMLISPGILVQFSNNRNRSLLVWRYFGLFFTCVIMFRLVLMPSIRAHCQSWSKLIWTQFKKKQIKDANILGEHNSFYHFKWLLHGVTESSYLRTKKNNLTRSKTPGWYFLIIKFLFLFFSLTGQHRNVLLSTEKINTGN